MWERKNKNQERKNYFIEATVSMSRGNHNFYGSDDIFSNESYFPQVQM
jgi:hypothetical protein